MNRVGTLHAHLTAASSSKAFSKTELAKFNGEDGQPVYLCLKGTVFDVTAGKSF